LADGGGGRNVLHHVKKKGDCPAEGKSGGIRAEGMSDPQQAHRPGIGTPWSALEVNRTIYGEITAEKRFRHFRFFDLDL